MPVFLQAVGINWMVERYVDKCPRCHRTIEVRTTPLAGSRNRTDTGLEVVFSCPNCQGFFEAIYKITSQTAAKLELEVLLPRFPDSVTFDRVGELSPAFVKIFNQSVAAEAHGLDEVAGVGYRKSLEFFLKDFCVSRTPDQASDIKRKSLGQVMNDYLEDGRIKEAGKRTAWLGNDETHFERKWEGKDLTDLKNLLRLVVSGIQEPLEYDFYLQEMDKPKT